MGISNLLLEKKLARLTFEMLDDRAVIKFRGIEKKTFCWPLLAATAANAVQTVTQMWKKHLFTFIQNGDRQNPDAQNLLHL